MIKINMNMNKKQKMALQILFITIVIGLFLYSCGNKGKNSDLKKYIEKLKQETMQRFEAKKALDLKIPNPVTYTVGEVRPPFGEPPRIGSNNENDINQSNPLLAYSLNVLKFVGTLSQKGTTLAFILAPDNVIYQVKVGSVVGDKQGKVINIQENTLEVLEGSGDGANSNQRVVTLQLKE